MLKMASGDHGKAEVKFQAREMNWYTDNQEYGA